MNLGCKNVNIWPSINKQALQNLEISLVIQINGKTRDVMKIKKDLNENEINNLVKNSSKANKYLIDKNIFKIIYVKNKIINYLIKN